MPNSVLPLPTGFGVTAITEHRSHRQPDPHLPPHKDASAGEHETPDQPQHHEADHHDTPPPLTDDVGVDPETLFATTLFANELLRVPPLAGEPRLKAPPEWAPPDSPLHLRDKLI